MAASVTTASISITFGGVFWFHLGAWCKRIVRHILLTWSRTRPSQWSVESVFKSHIASSSCG